jgi:hypothetical protein
MVWQEQETRTVFLKTRPRLANAAKKNGSPAFRTGRCAATDRPLDGLAESEVRTETMETLRQLAAPACKPASCFQKSSAACPRELVCRQKHALAVPAVDKPLHIHRTRCAESRLLKTSRFFSTIGAGSIQSLSSSFRAT